MGGSLDETAKTEALCQNKLNDRGSRILAMVRFPCLSHTFSSKAFIISVP